MIDVSANKELYISMVKQINRAGIDKLIEWLEKSDFFIAPASTKYHGNVEGGLCDHSINVYNCMLDLVTNSHIGQNSAINPESMKIVALFHDLCKVNFYKKDTRNVKKEGAWVTEPYYTIEEKFLFGGHGSKSVFITNQFIRLTPEEAAAINCHMGSWDDNKSVGDVYGHNALAWWLHVADEAASFLLERKT